MVMWHLSDRAIPRSYRMMEGFGVNTYRFVNAEGQAHFVKFHWKPKLGVHSLVWDEAQKIAGKDPDFHRRDLYDNIEQGNFPEYELGVQLIAQEDEFKFDFDILDPTKIWPEEEVPVRILGKMTLNNNVDNFFAETEQVAFHVGHVVPGIDFSNDPLLQGRLFSYTDTQLIRLGGPNFHELPINRPVCPFHNNQRDGYGRQTINVGPVSYHKNSIQQNTPAPVPVAEGGYEHYQEKVDGMKVRARSDSFKDHFTQARMFWLSMTDIEKDHILKAFSFEVGKVARREIRQQVVDTFANVDVELATNIAMNVGVNPPQLQQHVDTNKTSPAVSLYTNPVFSTETKKVAVIVNQASEELGNVVDSLKAQKITVELVSDKQQDILNYMIDQTLDTTSPVLYDGIIVAGNFADPKMQNKLNHFIEETYHHYKPLAFLAGANPQNPIASVGDEGVVQTVESFIEALRIGRHWNRPNAIG